MKNRIKEVRKEKGISQKELANRLGISSSTLSQIESEKNNVKIETLEKVAAALDCSIRDLIPTTTVGDHLAFETPEAFEAYHQSIIDDAYMDELRIPALKLNDRGKRILLDSANMLSENEDLIK